MFIVFIVEFAKLPCKSIIKSASVYTNKYIKKGGVVHAVAKTPNFIISTKPKKVLNQDLSFDSVFD